MMIADMPAKKKPAAKKIDQKTHLVEEPAENDTATPPAESSPQTTELPDEKIEPVVSQPVVAEPVPVPSEPTQSESTPPSVSSPVTPEAPQIVVNTTANDPSVLTVGDDDSRKKKVILVAVIALLVGSLAVGGYFLYNNFTGNSAPDQATENLTSEPPPAPAGTAESESSETLDYSQYPIKVLNGTVRKGEAAKLKAILEEAEFVVEKIGNAPASDYVLTEIAASEDVPAELVEKLREVLSKSYKLATDTGRLETSGEGLVVTIGAEVSP